MQGRVGLLRGGAAKAVNGSELFAEQKPVGLNLRRQAGIEMLAGGARFDSRHSIHGTGALLLGDIWVVNSCAATANFVVGSAFST
jgi:hypothetical protein